MDENWKRALFLNRQFEANDLKINGLGLGSSVDAIDYLDIIDIYVDQKGANQSRFIDRIELLKAGQGWIHLASGASFEIKKGQVSQIKLSTRYLQANKIHRIDFLKVFGRPDAELVDDICYSGFDYNIDAHVLVYRKKKIYAFLDPTTDRLIELHFGDFDEGLYGQWAQSTTSKVQPQETIVIKNRNRGHLTFFMAIWLLGWCAITGTMLYALFFDNKGRYSLLFTILTLLGIVGYLIWYQFLWNIRGKHILTFYNKHLQIEKAGTLSLPSKRKIDYYDLQGFDTTQSRKSSRVGLMWGFGGETLVGKCLIKNFYLAAGWKIEDAQVLAEKLNRILKEKKGKA